MMSKNYILALDQGTTSSRSILFDREGAIRGSSSKAFSQIYPRPGWVEHDPMAIWKTQRDTAAAAIENAGIGPDEVAAIGIANQRETTVVWERDTGKPIYNAIVWQCRRTAGLCDELKAGGYAEEVWDRTGLVLDAYFSGTKVKWILDHVGGARERAARGELCFGTIDSWILYNLAGIHATDYSNASRTMLYNIFDLKWDETLLECLAIPPEILPEVRPTSGVLGATRLFGPEIPVAALCGDQQSALFGQAAFNPQECKNTYGTGCFLLMNTGAKPVKSRHGLLTTIAWGLGKPGNAGRPPGGSTVQYALEGSVFIGGAVIQWLRDELGLIETAAESETIAAQTADTGGVFIVPAFAGLGAPYWNMHARGIITGLTRGTNRAHIVRAALEAIAFQSADVLSSMTSDTGRPIPALRVDGGAAANNILLQHQAEVLGLPVLRGRILETTALGAAFLAGLAVGFWPNQKNLAGIWTEDRRFTPTWSDAFRTEQRQAWANAVKKALA